MFKEVEDKRIKGKGKESLILNCDNKEGLNYMLNKGLKADVVICDVPYNILKNKSNKDMFSYDDSRDDYIGFLSERFKKIRDVMNEDAVLFVNISEHEMFNVGVMLVNIFGVENQLPLLYYATGSGVNNAKYIKKSVEPILVFAKDKSKLKPFNKVDNDLSVKKYFKDDLGTYRWSKTTQTTQRYLKRNDFVFKYKGVDVYPGGDKKGYELRQSLSEEEIKRLGIGKSFKYTKERLEQELRSDGLMLKESKGKQELYIKQRCSNKKTSSSLIDIAGVSNAKGTLDLKKVGIGADFSYPKAVNLYKYLIKLYSDKEKGCLVLDAFGGSGTSAVAVLELNDEDGGSRNFIIMQNNEGNICDGVLYKRVKAVSEGYTYKGKYKRGVGGNIRYLSYTNITHIQTLDSAYNETLDIEDTGTY